MTKQEMICPKAKECKKCPNPHHKYPHELIVAGYSDACDDLRGGCPACIPYIPEYECTDPSEQIYCLHLKPSGEVCNGCPRWQPKKPVTCPECGQPVTIIHRKKPADLKQAEPPLMKALADLAKVKVGKAVEAERQVSRDFDTIEHEPAEMPLREQFGRLLCKIDNAGCLRRDENACNPLNCPLTTNILDALLEAVEAPASAVASKAVKEFAEKCIKTMPAPRSTTCSCWECKDSQERYQKTVAHIRAMAEERR